MLAALAHTARDLGVGLLIGAAVLACLFFIGALLGMCIHGAEETPEFSPSVEPKDPGDLDDWLAQEGPLEEFKVSEHPGSSVQLGRRDT